MRQVDLYTFECEEEMSDRVAARRRSIPSRRAADSVETVSIDARRHSDHPFQCRFIASLKEHAQDGAKGARSPLRLRGANSREIDRELDHYEGMLAEVLVDPELYTTGDDPCSSDVKVSRTSSNTSI